LDGYRTEVGRGRNNMESELSEKLRTYVTDIKSKIDVNFEGFDEMIEKEEGQLAQLENRQKGIVERLDVLEMSVEI